MNTEFLVPTGWIIKEYLDYANMQQKEFSQRLGVSEKHISNFLNGKTRLTEDLALKIENVLPPNTASYWLNYEIKYQEYVARERLSTLYSIDELKVFAQKFHFNEVFNGLNWNLQKQADEMLKLLRLAKFENFEKVYGNSLAVKFMEDGGEKEAIAVWLGLARDEIEIQNIKKEKMEVYERDNLKQSLNKLKDIALNADYTDSIRSARKLLNRLGIYLVICDPLVNSKVRGALTSYDGIPTIYVSGRFKTHDNIWFALIHEIGHLLMHYSSDSTLISLENEQLKDSKEREANEFSRDFFINSTDYAQFIKNNSKNISEQAIRTFAQTQNVLPGIIVGRLQHDKIIFFDKFAYLKDK